jgi:hypothetical protein
MAEEEGTVVAPEAPDVTRIGEQAPRRPERLGTELRPAKPEHKVTPRPTVAPKPSK